MMGDCPAPSPSASSHSGGWFPIPSCWWCWDDGDRDQPPGYLMALGVLVACCVHGPAVWASNPTAGVIYTPPSRWLAGCLNLACGRAVLLATLEGQSGGGWVGDTSPVGVTAQSGTGGLHSVPAWCWGSVTAPAALLSAEPWAYARDTLPSCPVSPVDPQSR